MLNKRRDKLLCNYGIINSSITKSFKIICITHKNKGAVSRSKRYVALFNYINTQVFKITKSEASHYT
jgi:hypothetical protein